MAKKPLGHLATWSMRCSEKTEICRKVMELTNVFPYFVGLLALAFLLLVASGLT